MKHLIKLNEFFDYDSWLNRGNPHDYEEDENDPDYLIAGDSFSDTTELYDAIDPFISTSYYNKPKVDPLKAELDSNLNKHSNYLHNNITITSDDSKTKSYSFESTTVFTFLKGMSREVIDDFSDTEEVVNIEWVLYDKSILVGHTRLNLYYTIDTSPETSDTFDRPIDMVIMNRDFYNGLYKFTQIDDMFSQYVNYFTNYKDMNEFINLYNSSHLMSNNPITSQETDYTKRHDIHDKLRVAFMNTFKQYTINSSADLINAFKEIYSTISELHNSDSLNMIL